jgi:O-antigen ligase
MNKAALDAPCGRGIFGLVLALLVFTPVAFAGVDEWEFLVVQALTLGVVVLWTLRLWVSPQPQFLRPPIIWAALAFALYAIGRYLTADIEYPARLELIRVLVYTLLFLAILNNLYHQDRVQIISYTMIFLAAALASYAVAQFLGHLNHVWGVLAALPGRASGTFISPDHFSGFLEMILPLSLSLFLVGRMKPLLRILLGFSFLVILAGITVTFSRGGWVSAAVGVLVVLLVLIRHRNHRQYAALILLLLAGGGTWAATHFLARTPAFNQHILTSRGELNLDLFCRIKIWTGGWRMWMDHFWWGVGPGLFDWRFYEYRPQTLQTRPIWAHCDYLNILTDWGLVGGLIVLAGIGLGLAGMVRSWKRVRRSERDFGSQLSNRFAFFLGGWGGLAAIAVHSLVDFNLHIPADALLAATLLALLSSHLRFATERYWYKIRPPGKYAATFVLAAGTVYLGWQEYRLGGEAWHRGQADRFPNYTFAHGAALQAAFACEPMDFECAYQIGECYRAVGFGNPTNRPAMLDAAMLWYQRSEKLNPHYYMNWLRQGNTLDFLERPEEAAPCYAQADTEDPNGYYTAANIGWHYMQVRDYTAAEVWLQRCLALQGGTIDNSVARQCLSAVELQLTLNAGAFFK